MYGTQLVESLKVADIVTQKELKNLGSLEKNHLSHVSTSTESINTIKYLSKLKASNNSSM